MLLEVKNIEVSYRSKPVLHGVSLELDAGGMLGILGANGAGKTTILRAISGLTSVTSGEICFQGRRIDGLLPYAVAGIGIAAGIIAGLGVLFSRLSMR